MATPVSRFTYVPGEDGGTFLRLTATFTLGGNYLERGASERFVQTSTENTYNLDAEKSYFTKGFEVSLGVPIRIGDYSANDFSRYFIPTLMIRRIWSSLNTEVSHYVAGDNSEITDETVYTDHTVFEILPLSFGGPVAETPGGDVWLAFLGGGGIYFSDEKSGIHGRFVDYLGGSWGPHKLGLGWAAIGRLEASLPLGQPHLNLLLDVRGAAGQVDIHPIEGGIVRSFRVDVSGNVGLVGHFPDFNTWGTKAATTEDRQSTSIEETPIPEPTPKPSPVPKRTALPTPEEIIDDIGPWDPKRVELIYLSDLGEGQNDQMIIRGKRWFYSIHRSHTTFRVEDETGNPKVLSYISFESQPQYAPVVEHISKNFSFAKRTPLLIEQSYSRCQDIAKSSGTLKRNQPHPLVTEGYPAYKDVRLNSKLWQGNTVAVEIYESENIFNLGFSSKDSMRLTIIAKKGSALYQKYLAPLEKDLGFGDAEEPKSEPAPEEPTPPVRTARKKVGEDDAQEPVGPKPVSTPPNIDPEDPATIAESPEPVVPPRITSQKITSQTFDDHNIMSGRIEIVLDGTLEEGVKVVGQNGKEKTFVEKRTLGTSYIGERTHTEQLAYTIVIDFSDIHSSWTYTLFDKATGQEIGKITIKNPREVESEVKPKKPQKKNRGPLE